jgi:putative NADH-flavin reductase
MNVLVLGATGNVGRLVVREALRRGHGVIVLVRRPERLGAVASRVRVAQGDALDARAVLRAVAGQGAVVYVLGAGNVRQTTVFAESTKILLKAMMHHGVRRLICVTGVGAGETKGHGGFLYDRILYPLFTKGIYADKDVQEGLMRQSDLDWTIVRPAPFCTRTPPGPLRTVTNVDGVTLMKISRLEVARFLLDELEQNRYVHQAVFIGHRYAKEKLKKLQRGSVKGFIADNRAIKSLNVFDAARIEEIEKILQIRHLYTHQNGIVDDRFRKSFPAAKVNDEYRMTLDEFLGRFEYLAQAIEAVDEAARKDFKLAAFS